MNELDLLRRLALAVSQTVHTASIPLEIVSAYTEYHRHYPQALQQIVDGRVLPDAEGGFMLEWLGHLCSPKFDTVGAAYAYRERLRQGNIPEYAK